jgi:hypothetical protein
MTTPLSLFDKMWQRHAVITRPDGAVLPHVGRHLLHDGSRAGFRFLAELRVRSEIVRQESVYRIELAPDQTKTHVHDRFDLPEVLTPLRPALPGRPTARCLLDRRPRHAACGQGIEACAA